MEALSSSTEAACSVAPEDSACAAEETCSDPVLTWSAAMLIICSVLLRSFLILSSASPKASSSERSGTVCVKSPLLITSAAITCLRMPSSIFVNAAASWPVSSLEFRSPRSTSTLPSAIEPAASTIRSMGFVIMREIRKPRSLPATAPKTTKMASTIVSTIADWPFESLVLFAEVIRFSTSCFIF